MSRYAVWVQEHARKHARIVDKLKHLDDEALIAYFRYENMVQKEPDFCPLYAQGKKCHDMEALNCYLCACPNFRFDDTGIKMEGVRTLYSTCSIDSKEGGRYLTENAIHQDCSGCTVPHKAAYIREHFSRDWMKIMSKTGQFSTPSA